MNLQVLLTRLDKLTQTLQSPWLLGVLLSTRVLASTEHRRNLGHDLATVVDVGANRGQFSLAVRRWSPKARAIAFEPLPNAAAAFRRVFQGDSKVTLHEAAIGSGAGEATIHVSGADDSSSLLPISTLQTKLYPGTEEIGTETVKVGRLSDFISAKEVVSPALLKLDVQGYELDALRGCSELMQEFDYIIVECSFMELYGGQALAHEIIRFLDSHGFALSNVYNLEYDRGGQAVQGDFAFARLLRVGPGLAMTRA